MALALAAFAYDMYRMDKAYASSADQGLSRNSFVHQQTSTHEEKDLEYAMKSIGDDSVYKFFMGKSWLGWTFATCAVAIQLWLLFVFVQGAEIDWTSKS